MRRSRALETGGRQQSVWAVMLLVLNTCTFAAAQEPLRGETRQRARLAEGQRLEGQAMLTLADRAMGNRQAPLPGDFRIRWRNAFLKAQQGTFVPFTLTVDTTGTLPAAALVYIRAVPRGPGAGRGIGDRRRTDREPAPTVEYPVDAIFPVDFPAEAKQTASVSRGFSIAPGDYDVYVIVRERPLEPPSKAVPRAAVVMQALTVPDFWNAGLTTSTVILADRLAVLSAPLTADEIVERPYVIGQNEITPSADDRFRRSDELVVVFLVYNPTVTTDKHFDIQVEYHFFLQAGAGRASGGEATTTNPPARTGERYFNHTDPQRFNPAVMGGSFDPTAGHPVLAGQGIPLAGFERGDYRLAITVKDLVSGKSVTRDVAFTVES